VAASWDPEWVRVTSDELVMILYDEGKTTRDMVGWLTCLSDRYGPLPSLPSAYDVMRLDGWGSAIVIKTTERFTASNDQHVRAANQLADILIGAGVLTRTSSRR
jgi:hypothetical protein